MPTRWHPTTWCAERASAFLAARRDGPWTLSVNPFAPHPPIDPPPAYLARVGPAAMPLPRFRPADLEQQGALAAIDFQTRPRPPAAYDARRMVAAYYAQIEHVDAEVGRILDALERTGQREDTLVIFMSDHGEMLGDHGLRIKGCRFYEGLVHVPLIVSWPGQLRAGLRSAALVELLDLAPTLLEATGLPIPAHMQGRSLLPLLTGQAEPDRHREYHDALALPGGSRATMLRDERHKLVVYHGQRLGELYDLRDDPDEFSNLWDDPARGRQVGLAGACFRRGDAGARPRAAARRPVLTASAGGRGAGYASAWRSSSQSRPTSTASRVTVIHPSGVHSPRMKFQTK